MDQAQLADALLPVVLEAARVQMRYFKSGTAITTKSDATPVTAADQESEALIVAALARIAPGVPIIAEEAVATSGLPQALAKAEPRLRGGFFLVDPLDGTREFVADRPEFTINIAHIVNGVPRFGIIYAPAMGMLYVTTDIGQAVEVTIQPTSKATRFADTGATEIHTRKAPAEGLVAVASRSHATPGTDAFLGQYKVIRRTAAGSSLKFCLVAKGAADIYPRVGRTMEWDTAAGHAVLAAAGGTVTTLDGVPLLYGNVAQLFRNPDYVAWGRQPLTPEH